MFTHILVCADGSEPSLKAAQTAADLAQKCSAQVTLLHVLDPRANALPVEGAWEASLGAGAMAYYRHEAELSVEQPTRKFFTEADVECQWKFKVGYPVETVLESAADLNADLIVLGSRGLGGFKRLMLGSVSDGVLHHAHCPVLIVR